MVSHEHITLELSQGKFAVIDAADFEAELYCEFRDGFVFTGRICDRKWSTQVGKKCDYAFCMVQKKRQIYLHRLVMCAGRLQIIDHEDGNGLHCWRSNLRLATSKNNSQNRKPRGDRKYKGVYFHKMSGKYQAAIGIDGKSNHLGLFKDEESAARAYDLAALTHFGEFARLNFPGATA